MEELSERLNQAVRYLVWKGYVSIQATQKDIAERMGTTTSNVSAALKGSERFLTEGFVNRFSNAFKGIFNEKWIINGDGTMTNESVSITNVPITEKDIKILDIRVSAGHGIGFDGDENKILGYVNIPNFSGCYGVTVYGDSMYDKYSSGDIVFVREIKDKREIEGGQSYVVITNEDRYLKMIYIEDGKLKLVSYNNAINPDGRRKYPDMLIEGEQIKFLYKVVGRLERTQI
ncbi:S24 family peptidase [Candidatus Bacteroides intestinigallinarum]|jgi:phage repressor protein C with HTH and peptisase S24 domain|uniref:S24 family peptidase n=1 Tax=Candidatus Bacteroides intestinigallinarum TaxID=2838470 RepID=UPI0039B39B8F